MSVCSWSLARLSYFKQLQILSDEVADPDLSPVMFKGFSEELAAIETEESMSIEPGNCAKLVETD